MYHKIGTLAKRFGITPQALRFYEGNGLLAPDHPPESGERRYQASRFKDLYSIRRYHDLGYSLEETLTLFSYQSVEELEAMAAEKEAEIQRKLEFLERRKEALGQHRRDLEQISRLFHRCEVTEMPRLWLLMDQEGQDVDLSPAIQDEVQEWMRFLPWVYAASAIDGEKLRARQEERPRKSGFCIEEKMAQRLGMPRGPHTVETPGGRRAVHTVTALDRYPITTEDFLGYALAYAQERGLTLSGAVGRCLAKTGEDRCRDQRYPKAVYYEYWLLIEE